MVRHKKSITFILVMVMLLSLFAGPSVTTEAETAIESQENMETEASLLEAEEPPNDADPSEPPDPTELNEPEPTPESTSEATEALPPDEEERTEEEKTEPSTEPSDTESNTTPPTVEDPPTTETSESRQPTDTEPEATEPEATEPEETETEVTEPPAEPTDHLTYPDGMAAVTSSMFANVPIPLARATRSMMMQSANLAASSIGGTIGTDHPTTPGEVMLFKQATPVAGMVNTWDVTVRIEAKDSSSTSDIVLVLDRSGSMSGTRLASMKTAAKSFVSTLLSNPEQTRTRIAIVSFGPDVTLESGFSTNTATLNGIIDSMTASGGTYTQAGLRSAGSQIATSTADKRSIVLLSDGEPTYSTAINNPQNYLIPWTYGRNQTSTAVPQSAYNYTTRVGNASSMRTAFSSSSSNYYNHGNSAIAEAGFIKNSASSPKIYTIALSPTGESGSVLQNISSGSGYAYTSSPSDLNGVFGQIAGALMQGARNASVNDPMGTGFVVSGNVSSITVSKGSATYNQATKTINWTIGNIDQNAGFASPHNDVRYAQMTYRIEIDDSILTVPTPADGLYETNKTTTLSYTDINGSQTSGNFPIPKVDPVLLIVEKKLLDANGNAIAAGDGRLFTINVKNSGGTTYDHNYPVQVGQRKVLTNLRYETTYKVTEPTIGGTPPSSPSDYDTTINIFDTDTDTFTVHQGSKDTTILVTNKERALGELVVKKVFDPVDIIDNGGVAPVTNAPDFGFEVTGPNGYVNNFTLKAGESETLTGLTYGTYSVIETNTHGFTASYSDTQGNLTDGNVVISIDSKSHTVTVTNRPEVTQADIVAKKIYKAQNGDPESNIAPTFILFADGLPVNPVTHPYVVSPNSGQHSEFTYTWANMPIYNANGSVIVYSVDEIDVPRFTKEIEGMTITNTFGGGDKRNVVAVKVWVNGGETKPTVWFKLYRYIFESQTAGDAVEVPGAAIMKLVHGTTTVTWPDMPIDHTSTETYRYLVREVDEDGNDFKPPGYEKEEDGLIVTNKYVPSKIDVTAKKVWEGGPANDRPEIWLGLFRSLDNGATLEKVPETVLKQPAPNSDGELVATWDDVEATSLEDETYTFHVREFQDEEGKEPFESLLYEVTLDGLTVTNTYIPPTIPELKATKIWEGGPNPRPLVGFRLYRETEGLADSLVAVPDAEVKMLVPPGTVEVSWFDMPEKDNEGRLYIYSVREVIIKPNDDPTAPPEYLEQAPLHYIDTYTDSLHNDGITVTNTYQIPTDGEATATKTWVGGSALGERPTVWFKLYRTLPGGQPEEVPDAPLKALPHGTTEVSWTGLETTDFNGEAYAFSVEEVDEEGNAFEPDRYRKLELGLNVSNIYTPDLIDIMLQKIWINAPSPVPTVYFKLERRLEGQSEDQDEIAAVLQELQDGNDTLIWANMAATDEEGVPYIYSVKEVGPDGEYFTPTAYAVYINRMEHQYQTAVNTYTPPIEKLVNDVDNYVMTDMTDALEFRVTFHMPDDTRGYQKLVLSDEIPAILTLGTPSVEVDGTADAALTALITVSGQLVELTISEAFEDLAGKEITLIIPATVKADATVADLLPYLTGEPIENIATLQLNDLPDKEEDRATVELPPGAPPTPEKTVNGEETTTLTNLDETFEYAVSVKLPNNVIGYEKVMLKDILPDVLEIGNASVKVDGAEDAGLTAKIDISGQTISLTIDSDFSALAGKEIQLVFEAKVKATATAADLAPYMTIGEIENTAELYFNDDEEAKEDKATVELPPGDPPQPEKTVNGESQITIDDLNEDLTYRVSFEMPKNVTGYEKIVLVDDMPDILVLGTVVVNVNGTADAVLTGKVSVTGQKVSLTLDTGLIELAEKTIELVIPAKIKPDATEDELKPYMAAGKIKNKAQLFFNDDPEAKEAIAEVGLPGTTIVEATKSWINAPETHPTTWFKLFRQTKEMAEAEAVPAEQAAVLTLENGTETVSWAGIKTHDKDGNPYTFSVREVDADGNDFTPLLYEKVENGLTVENTYLGYDPIEIDPPVEKKVEGQQAPTGARFTFQMKALTSGSPLPEGATGDLKTVTITGPGSVEFGKISYDTPGLHRYQLSEINNNEAGFTYDKATYEMIVDVKDEAGTLVAHISYLKDGKASERITFTNTYEATKPPVPKTGESRNLLSLLLALSAIGAAVVLLLIKKRRHVAK